MFRLTCMGFLRPPCSVSSSDYGDGDDYGLGALANLLNVG